jgi:beta-lactamase class A
MSALGNHRSRSAVVNEGEVTAPDIADDTAAPPAIPGSRVARRRAKRRRRRQLLGSVCAVALLAGVGAAIANRGSPPPPRSAHQSNGKRTSPSVSTTAAAAAAAHDVVPGSSDLFTQPSVAAYLTTNTPEDITAAVYDDDTGVTSVYRPDTPEVTASSMKVDILTTLLAQEQAAGQSLTAAQQATSVSMIEDSDNDAAQSLWDQEGGAKAVERFDAAVGLTETDPDSAGYWGLSSTTAADQVQLLRTLAYPSTLLAPASQSYELGLMSHVESAETWGVSAGPTAGTAVALKDGWLPIEGGGWQVNSEGYVNGDGRNYVIAVMTYGTSEATGIATIEGLSSLIWQELAPSTS